MKLKLIFFGFFLFGISQTSVFSNDLEKRGVSLTYDFSFVNLAIKYLETGNTNYLYQISELDATRHIFNHASKFGGYDGTKLELVTDLLSPRDRQKKLLPIVKRNLEFAKNLAKSGVIEKITLQYLPKDFRFSGSLFFTFGYDIGVVFGENSSLNLAHPIFSNDVNEIKFWAIHESHHAGFVQIRDGYMPSIRMTTFKEMARLIEYLVHLEGMATFSALNIREQKNAMNTHRDYIALQDVELMRGQVKDFFDIYFHFKNNPDNLIAGSDWQKIHTLTTGERLLYTVGTHIARTIDQNFGREKLVSLISEPSENFITAYLELKK